MVQAMLGVTHTSKEGEKFALEVMNYMKEKCDKWKAETGLGFGLYGTPAESLTSRFCRIDKRKFGEIENITDRMYYTNSYHVHVAEEIDAFEKLNFESQFHAIINYLLYRLYIVVHIRNFNIAYTSTIAYRMELTFKV